MRVVKRDKSIEEFQFSKIERAVAKAYEECNLSVDDSVFDCMREKYSGESDELVNVEDIQDDVEKCLMDGNKEVAKAYIIYRYQHKLIRENKEKIYKGLTKKLMADDVTNQNANVDEHSFGGRMGEATRLVTKDYALSYCMTRKSRNNHLNNEIYIHDMDSYAVGEHNCLTIPFDDLLKNGFSVRQTDIRGAKSINTAFQLVAVLFQVQSLEQFGGVAASHLDWTMVPYVKMSFYKHYKVGMKYIENKELGDEYNNGMSIDDEKYKKNAAAYRYAMDMTVKELEQAVEGMYHNLNSLQSRSGSQLPFSSINYGTCTLPEGRMVIKALLEGSINGVGKYHRTPIFPCGIFQMMSGVNRKEGEPNYDLYKLALKSTSQRLYPNYANCDWSGNAGYDKNDPRTYFATMGCHAKDTPIIMADGTKKMVQDIVVGDKIMGVDNQVRTVQSLIRGNDRLFKINQSRAESYIVNEGHILSLVYTSSKKYKGLNKGDKVNISVHDYLEIPFSTRRFLKGYKSSYELSEKEFLIPPYILGLWLGDGNSRSTRFSVNTNETQIVEDLGKYAASIGKKLTIVEEEDEKCLSVDVCNSSTMSIGNKFRQALIKLNLMGNKHIPEEYFYGSKEQRSALLAGLLNTDGWARRGRGRKSVCFGNTNLNLIEGAKRLADSLGYNTNIIKARGETIGTGICEGSILKPYYHLNIHSFDDPHLMEHKRSVESTSKRNFDTSTITIEEVEPGDFYGFELDGDRLYLINDGTVTHNCRTVNLMDINGFGQLKDGRGNICPVTIILPTLAMETKDKLQEKCEKEGVEMTEEMLTDAFMKYLGKKIGEARDMLIERFEWICSQPPSAAKFMWGNNSMAGYIPEEGVRSALKHGTLAIGQIGLAETLQILIGCDHTSEKGMELAKKIEGLYKERCAKYKNEYKLNFGVYYTPAENLCYTSMKKFRDKYGIIPNVSDRDYFTNSMHVPVWKEMTPFEKIDIESQLTGYSSAGCITYVELPSTTKNNIEALETIVNYAMDKDIPYFACNLKIDNCNSCGYSDEIGEKCPMCGSTDISRLRRVTGYLSGDYKTAFNYGKQKETEDRVEHLKIN